MAGTFSCQPGCWGLRQRLQEVRGAGSSIRDRSGLLGVWSGAHRRALCVAGPVLPQCWRLPSGWPKSVVPTPLSHGSRLGTQEPGPGQCPPRACCPDSQILLCPPGVRKVLFLLWHWFSPTRPPQHSDDTPVQSWEPMSRGPRMEVGSASRRAESARRALKGAGARHCPPARPGPGPSLSPALALPAVWPAQGVHRFCTSARVCT